MGLPTLLAACVVCVCISAVASADTIVNDGPITADDPDQTGRLLRDDLAYAYLPAAIGPGDRVAVEVFGELVEAEVADDVPYDPRHERVRA